MAPARGGKGGSAFPPLLSPELQGHDGAGVAVTDQRVLGGAGWGWGGHGGVWAECVWSAATPTASARKKKWGGASDSFFFCRGLSHHLHHLSDNPRREGDGAA